MNHPHLVAIKLVKYFTRAPRISQFLILPYAFAFMSLYIQLWIGKNICKKMKSKQSVIEPELRLDLMNWTLDLRHKYLAIELPAPDYSVFMPHSKLFRYQWPPLFQLLCDRYCPLRATTYCRECCPGSDFWLSDLFWGSSRLLWFLTSIISPRSERGARRPSTEEQLWETADGLHRQRLRPGCETGVQRLRPHRHPAGNHADADLRHGEWHGPMVVVLIFDAGISLKEVFVMMSYETGGRKWYIY